MATAPRHKSLSMRAQSPRMQTLSHYRTHVSEGFVERLARALASTFEGFSASWDRLMVRSLPEPAADEDIDWEDGEPREAAETP